MLLSDSVKVPVSNNKCVYDTQDALPVLPVFVEREDVSVAVAPAAAGGCDHDPAAACTDHDYAVVQLQEPYEIPEADNWKSLTVRTFAASVHVHSHSSIVACGLWFFN